MTAHEAKVRVKAVSAHSPHLQTQGLALSTGGFMVESSGGYGTSCLQVYARAGNAWHAHGEPIPMPSTIFAEDIVHVRGRTLILTWRERLVLVLDPRHRDVSVLEGAHLDREGWGACSDGEHIYTSDGTSQVVVRNLMFEPLASFHVTDEHGKIWGLNALTWVPDRDEIVANIDSRDLLIGFSATGKLHWVANCTPLRSGSRNTGYFNGVAALPSRFGSGHGSLLVTGKGWRDLLEVSVTRSARPLTSSALTRIPRGWGDLDPITPAPDSMQGAR